jgi:hypothetical protein
VRLPLPIAIALTILLAACGSDDDTKPRATPTATVRTPTGTPATATSTATQPVSTATSTPHATNTNTAPPDTATATATPQATDTEVVTATATATGTAPATATHTAPATATNTAAPTATATPVPTDTATPSATPTATRALSVRILEPANGSTITTVSFTIRAQVEPPDAEMIDVGADLNGTAIGLSAGTVAGQYVTEIGPNDALQEDNVLTVTAVPAGSTAAVSNTVGFRYLPPPRAVARRITDPADLITGPLADGRVGDWLLANGVARFIIQDAPQRNLYSVGAFGGNIIDAELVGHPGLDNFLEIQPAVQIETVINAQTVEIVNDGADGRPASIRTCGPDDVLDFVNPSTIIEDIGGLPFPAAADDADYNVEGCTEYSLAPGERAVKMVTTLFNNDDVDRGFFVGDYINAGGEVEQWTNSGSGLGEILTSDLSVMSYIGYGEAAGVDYAHVTVPIPGSPHPGSSFFTAAGVSYVMQSNSVIGVILGGAPTFVVPAHGSNSFTRYFAVGDGSGSNAIDFERAIKGLPVGALHGCVTIGGAPAPQARVAVGPIASGKIASVASIFVTGPDGCYRGTLPPGAYGVAAARQGAPYEGGGPSPVVHPITVVEGESVEQDVALPATGRVRVQVTDADEQPIPARVAIIGFDPSPEVVFPGSDTTGLFYDQKEALHFGFTHVDYTDSAGHAEFEVEPGDYAIAVSRGMEYSLFTQPLTVTAGEPVDVRARIARVLDTTGFVSSDFHVHGIASADARVPDGDRVRQFAGEGVDNIIMTDHHAHTDLTPTIERLGFAPFVHATVGEEITTWDYGHYNAYPLLVDPTLPNGGSTDWAGAAPPGKDFRSLGAYSLNLPDLQVLAETGPNTTPDTVVQVNHIDSTFDPLRIDTALVPPRSLIPPEDLARFRLDPNSGNQFTHFKALELWNGSSRGKQSEFLDTRLGIWFNHLNQGLRTTAIGDTDTHEFLPLNSAGARTWTASPTDDPAAIDPADVARAVRAGRAVLGQGVYVQARLRAGDDSGAVADLTLDGSVDLRSESGTVWLDVDAQAPLWAPFDRIEIYANANTVVARERGGTPTLYGAEPTLVLQAGVDVPLQREVVDDRVPGAERWVSRFTLPFPLQQDTWFVVIVKGTDGVSHPMFPVFGDDLRRATNTTLADLVDDNLGEDGTLALGMTNALYADVDGTPGFNPPRTQ